MPDFTHQQIEVLKILINMGGAVVIAVFLIFILFRLLKALIKIGEGFVRAHEQVADSLSGLKTTVAEYTTQDNKDHREILMLQKLVLGELKALTINVKELKNGHINRNTEPDKRSDIKILSS
jgi:hypothetical protein